MLERGEAEERRDRAGDGRMHGADAHLDLLLGLFDVARSVEQADMGGVVLVDGDLVPDWRVPSSWLASLLDRAADRFAALRGDAG